MRAPVPVLDACLDAGVEVSTLPPEIVAFAEHVERAPAAVLAAWGRATKEVEGESIARVREIIRDAHFKAYLSEAEKVAAPHYTAPLSEAVTLTLLGATSLTPRHDRTMNITESEFMGGIVHWDGGDACTRFRTREGFESWSAGLRKLGVDPDIVAIEAGESDGDEFLPAYEDLGDIRPVIAQMVALQGGAVLTEFANHYANMRRLGVKRPELAALYECADINLEARSLDGRILEGAGARLLFSGGAFPKQDAARVKWLAEHTGTAPAAIQETRAKAVAAGFSHPEAWIAAIHFAAAGSLDEDVCTRSDALVHYVHAVAEATPDGFEVWLREHHPTLAKPAPVQMANPAQVYAVPNNVLTEVAEAVLAGCKPLALLTEGPVTASTLEAIAHLDGCPDRVRAWAFNALAGSLQIREAHALDEASLARVMEKEDARTFPVPKSVHYTVRLGRMTMRQHGVRVNEATKLISERLLKPTATYAQIRRMARLEAPAVAEHEHDAATVAFLMRGGRPGAKWARSIVAEVEGSRAAAK